VAAASLLVAALAVAGCADEVGPSDDTTGDATALPPDSLPHLDVPDDAVMLLAPGPDGAPEQLGSGTVEAAYTAILDGTVTVEDGIDETQAFSFPGYQERGDYPRAAIAVTNAGPDDVLSPGTEDFVFGADFRLDEESVGREEDNGNNIIQRGLSSDDVMFKLDIDADHRPGCTIKGRDGKQMIYARQPVEDGLWYRVHCERQGDRLHVLVSEYLPSGQVTTSGRETSGPTGTVDIDAEVPLSVGGKVARNSAMITSATDQFNGDIANPFLLIGRVDHG
jgi:hypothetical protein